MLVHFLSGIRLRAFRPCTPANPAKHKVDIRRFGFGNIGVIATPQRFFPTQNTNLKHFFSTMSEADWKKKLTKEEYHVLREKGTERPGTGEYDKYFPKEGYFACRGCMNPLYSYEAKFNSGCGWPAFDKCFKGAIKTQ